MEQGWPPTIHTASKEALAIYRGILFPASQSKAFWTCALHVGPQISDASVAKSKREVYRATRGMDMPTRDNAVP